MKSRITAKFRQAFGDLPEQIQEQTREAYRLFKQNPSHPSLRFKKVHPELPIYSARISKSYRAVGQLEEDTVIWFWLGSHAEYDKLLSQF
ncbi:hypothetical protein H6G76_30645 [Nostoc sp. FACHB-152]|uniref:ParE family toxin-like protein n=1 Tax=unclassified Nostoc TaxID=2593658 RepID=UPI00168593C6|nr:MULTISPECIES: hypothetical protein [unclassified Nostoc]MBD2451406.1 hypothetical protein [Nostoc sp. FACHB-152]MBD2469388.1 hypothetical protein [Nostoc sp. FACHB-145]